MDGQTALGGMAGRRARRRALRASFVLCIAYAAVVLGAGVFFALYPDAAGTLVIEKNGFTVDISNATEGYIMMKRENTDKRLKARVIHDAKTTATYNLNGNGEFEVYPLSLGSGEYEVHGYINVDGDNYALEMKKKFQVILPEPDTAFLYPNTFVSYTPESAAVAKSMELCDGLETDQEKLAKIYDYVSSTIMYDYVKAVTVSANRSYMPDVDETLSTRMGICFDYSALLACMLRVQGIPAKLVIGDLIPTSQYHAWNYAKVDGLWVLLDATLRNMGYGGKDYAVERFY